MLRAVCILAPYHAESGTPCLTGFQHAGHELRLRVLIGVEQGWHQEGGDVHVPSQVLGSAGGHVLRPALFGPWV